MAKWSAAQATAEGIPQVRADITIKDGDNQIEHFYLVCGSLDKNGEPVAPEGWVTPGYSAEFSYSRFLYAFDLRERAAKRESVAETSTIIMVKGKPRDLMALPVHEAVAAINAARAIQKITGKDAGKAFENAAARLLADGAVTEKDSVLAAKRK